MEDYKLRSTVIEVETIQRKKILKYLRRFKNMEVT